MFERFTERAINVVIEAQNIAKEMNSAEVYPEHLFLALVNQAKGVSLKFLRMYHVSDNTVKVKIKNESAQKGNLTAVPPFAKSSKDILKYTLDLASQSGNSNILFEHLFLALITSNNSIINTILSDCNFDIQACKSILTKLVQKKIKKLEHPEGEKDEPKTAFETNYESEALADVFERAVAKATSAGYEILGTEQILASVLETQNSQLNTLLEQNGLNADVFSEKLLNTKSRKAEFEDKKYVFTPNAFLMMNTAIQTAKELGESEVLPEHILLSILKTKKGLAYDIIKSLNLNEENIYNQILKPIEKQMPETLTVMKLAKEEARRIGRNVVGTEMLLLGILGEGTNYASTVLNNLEVTMKDARIVVESLVGYGNEYFDEEIVFTNRAKHVLEKAWMSAKKLGKQKIEAIDLLLAITDEPESLAMKALDLLGVDVAEIKHGIQGLK